MAGSARAQSQPASTGALPFEAASSNRDGLLETWLPPLVLGVLALVLRLWHVAQTARLLVADDAVFFEQHAVRFLDAWRAVGTPAFFDLLREAVDHASLQGVQYPFFQSLVYLVTGGVNHGVLALIQAVLGAATVVLTCLTARRAFGGTAGLAAGTLVAVYPPLVISSGLLLAEALLTFLQALALYLAIRGVTLERRRWLLAAGVCTGLLMIRPAFQYAGILLLTGVAVACVFSPGDQRRRQRQRYRRASLLDSRMALPAAFLAGVLLIAIPWVAVNGLVYGAFVWSRTGDAWQQVYWGIYPPNRGWWPPDSPVPPKYGVESLPGAWAAGATIQPRDLDYLEAAIDQVRATPLKATATEINKLYQAYLHPYNPYSEQPPLVAGLAVPLHRLLAVLALGGLCLGWRRLSAAVVLAAGLLAFSLPFLVSHIDLRYTVPASQIGAIFAGLLMAETVRALRHSPAAIAAAGGATLAALALSALDTGTWLEIMPGLHPWHIHLGRSAALALVIAAVGVLTGRLLAPPRRAFQDGGRERLARSTYLVSGLIAGCALAGVLGVQALYDGEWHEWSATIRAGQAVRQSIQLPATFGIPDGGRAELRLYLQGSHEQTYIPVVRASSQEIARLGPAFTDAGPLRFEASIMRTASQQGKARADVPQWYAVALDAALLDGRTALDVEVTLEPLPDAPAAAAPWLRIWGDYPTRPGVRLYDGPAVVSRIPGASESFHKFVATGHYAIWRKTPLASSSATAVRLSDGRPDGTDLSEAPGRQIGEYRIRLLVYGSTSAVEAVY